MTGFAIKTTTLVLRPDQQSHISMSIKTLNSRFFEMTCKLPPSLSSLETTIMMYLKKRLMRGNIFVTIHMSDPFAITGTITPSFSTARGYFHALTSLKKELALSDQPITLDQLLRFSNIINVCETEIDKKSEKEIMDLIAELTQELLADRLREGKSLYVDLVQRISVIEDVVEKIAQRSQAIIEEQKKKIHLLSMTKQQEQPDINLPMLDAKMNVLYIALDKMDIHEEIIRIKSHLKNLCTILDDTQEEEKGKRIDFTLQELGREINTITAKCADSEMSTHAINIKVEVEKAREQAQNIV
jgi:uncharacterized protein (TIGR00255 family)